jgi:hypothetical protein
MAEAKKTNTGLVNEPGPEQLKAMVFVANKVFEPLREWYGKPITINSFFRSTAVNRMVKGSASSQHVKGEAIDITGGNKTENKKLYDYIKANLDYDQLINEYDYTWVHVSYTANGKNRKQQLIVD